MTFMETLKENTRNMELKKLEIMDEILDDFRNYYNSDAFKKYLTNRFDEKTLLDRSCDLWCSFWDYTDGCSRTNFTFCGHTWENGKMGWDSREYKGINLYDIHKEICESLMEITLKELRNLGFVHHVKDNESRLGYYKKTITIVW